MVSRFAIHALLLSWFAVLLPAASQVAFAADRVALVIGNGTYANATDLAKSAADSRAISGKLKELGFEVTHAIDRSRTELNRLVQAFVHKADGAKIAVFFYSGYGMQVHGDNYLIPIDAKLSDVDDASFELLALNQVISAVEGKAQLTLMLIDAARDNPFAATMKGLNRAIGGRGLSRLKQPSIGMLLSLSAEPGAVSIAGSERHSPYVHALMQYLGAAEFSISQIMTRVRQTVFKMTQGKQIPRDYNSMLEDFRLFAAANNGSNQPGTADTDRLQHELAQLQAKLAKLQGQPADASGSASDPDAGKYRIGEVLRDCGHCPELVIVPKGDFLIGSPKNEDRRVGHEGPRKKITLTKPFAAGRFEVTLGEFQKYVRATSKEPVNFCWEEPGFIQTAEQPVICVTWSEAKNYVDWLAKSTGKPFRLLSEAEWEYVARAGKTTMYTFGRLISPRLANYHPIFDVSFSGAKRSAQQVFAATAVVSALRPNAFGLYHVHGNVAEWVSDCYIDSYENLPLDGKPFRKETCSVRVLRGGSWKDFPWKVRSAHREYWGIHHSSKRIGFRVARELLDTEAVRERLTGKALARALQQQLKRVGCLAGLVDGDWGPGSRKALSQFNRRAKKSESTRTPSEGALHAVRRMTARVCVD
ncbi:MAG: SUMF1/EgtB/PvdO family nonheme iron enzyme [Alphaproteobacteria bacterium]|nr:SUMF1/EgtB/PvdO family nonheme iron enzyme [Alphaproteobacteria bacterium]